MRLLANQKGELCFEDGTLSGYVQTATPKMRDVDKESRATPPKTSLRSRRSNTAQLTYHSNMARMTAQLALAEFQDASSPIMFHRFDDIPVP